MSGSVDLLIETGADWGIQIGWASATNDPIVFSDPVMNMRQDLNTQGKLIAKLDESGQWDGTIQIISPGVLQAKIPASNTNLLTPGHGFWDIYVNVQGERARLVFGTVSIAAHVTELTDGY